MTEMKIVRKGRDGVAPEGGFRARIKSGDTMRLTSEPGAEGRITFDGDSPFGVDRKAVKYGTSLPVTVSFDPSQAQKNVYAFTCHLTVKGKTFSSKSGGEIEVIKP